LATKFRILALVAGCCFTSVVCALPEGMQVKSGDASSSRTTNQLIINNSPNSIIDWKSFSINAGELATFNQQNANSAVLNRVIGNELSKIYGELRSNGKVYLINPNGIVVGPSGQINTAAFFASTHDIDNQDFLDGGSLLFKDSENKGAIVNLGKISATEGDVFLIASEVRNEGDVSAPKGTTGLVAAGGSDVLLANGSDRRVLIKTGLTTRVSDEGVVNKGTIEAARVELAAAGGNVYALAIKNDGVIRASTLQRKGGRVLLVSDGGNIELSANSTIDASGELGGGEINVGGSQQGKGALPNASNLTVKEAANIKADAIVSGDGGRVILYSDKATTVEGKVSARGGSESGDGGFVEVSGKEQWRFDNWLRNVDVSAQNGKAGIFLIDPNDINIVDGSGAAIGSSPVNTNTLNDADIENFLNNVGSLIIETSGTGGSGDITLNANSSITWNSVNDLLLTATRRFRMTTATIESNGSGAITINNTGATAGNAVEITGSTITSKDGDIVITGNAGTSNTNSSSGIVLDNSTISSTGTGASAATITLTGTGSSASSSAFGRGNNNKGVILQNGAQVSSVDGDIVVAGTGGNLGESFNIGVEMLTGTKIISTGLGADAASISVTGTSRNRRAIVTEDCFFPGGCTVGYNSASGKVNWGVRLEGAIDAVNGNVTLTGQTGTNLQSANNEAIYISSGSINMTGDGNVTIQGTSPTSEDFKILGTSTIGGANALGDITIVGNEFNASGTTNFQSRGDLSISANTTSTSIGLGSGTGTLNINAAEFNYITDGFNSVSIGDAAAGTGTVNIGTLSIADALTTFGGTINTTGPVTERGTANVLTPTTGTVGTVNFAAYADPTANPAVPSPPSPPSTPTPSTPVVPTTSAGGGAAATGDANQSVINKLNKLDERLAANTPQLTSDSLEALPESLRRSLLAAVSREKLLAQRKADSAELLEQARLEREKEITRQKALAESRARFAKKLDEEEARRIDAFNAQIAYRRSNEYFEKVRQENIKRNTLRNEADRKKLAAEEKAKAEADEAARLQALKDAELRKVAFMKQWLEERRIEALIRKQRAEVEERAAKFWAEIEARRARKIAELEKLKRTGKALVLSNLAKDHEKAGRLLAPPGENALELLREAQEILPDSEGIKTAIQDLSEQYIKQVDKLIAGPNRRYYRHRTYDVAMRDFKRAQEQVLLAEKTFGLTSDIQALKDRLAKAQAAEVSREQARIAAEQRSEAQRLAREKAIEDERLGWIAKNKADQAKRIAAEETRKEKARLAKLADEKKQADAKESSRLAKAQYNDYLAKKNSATTASQQIKTAKDRIGKLLTGRSPLGDPGMSGRRTLHPDYLPSLYDVRFSRMTPAQAENLDMESFKGLDQDLFNHGDPTHDALKSTMKKHYEMANSLAPPPQQEWWNAAVPNKSNEEALKKTDIDINTPATLSDRQEEILTSAMESRGLIPAFTTPKLKALSLEDKVALGEHVAELKGAQARAEQAKKEGREVGKIDKLIIQGGVHAFFELNESIGGDPTGGILESLTADAIGEIALRYDISVEAIIFNPLNIHNRLGGTAGAIGKDVIGTVKLAKDFVTDPVNTTKKTLGTGGKAVLGFLDAWSGGSGGPSQAELAQREKNYTDDLTKFRDNLRSVAQLRTKAKKQMVIRKESLKQILVEEAKLRTANIQLAQAS